MPVPAVRFPEPTGFDVLPKKERIALRRAWKTDPKTIAARNAAKAARAKLAAEKRAAFKRGFDRWVLSPVLPLIAPALHKELSKLKATKEDGEAIDDDDKDDVIDEVFEQMKKKADDFAEFEGLKALPLFGNVAAEGMEALTDGLIEQASSRLEELVREKLEEILAGLDEAGGRDRR